MLIPQAPPSFKSGFIAIIGRPNVGKSTLMNQLIGQKIAITSPIAQTTRNRLRGILTTETAQFIFVDTPGIHKPQHSLGHILVNNAKLALNAVDLILFVVDGSVVVGGGDRYIAELLKTSQAPVLLGLNKTDLLRDPQSVQATYQDLAATYGWKMSCFSALTATGLPELQQHLEDQLPPGPYYYPPDLVTDQPERFIMGELVREQILAQTRDEVPHSVAVAIEQVVEETKITKILASIYVERPSQKAILIGKGGQMLKTIGIEARLQIQKLILGPVYLELFVKVRPKWRQSKVQLTELGYRVEAD